MSRADVAGLGSLDDEQLIVHVQNDEPDAFRVLYERHCAHALNAASAVNTEHAHDAVQDGFISVWRDRARYSADEGSVHAWIITIVRRRALDRVRFEARRAQSGSADGLNALTAPGSLEDDAVTRGEGDRLRVALRRLPERQREVILLAFFGGLTHQQIAARLRLAEGTVKGRMRLGLDKLRCGEVGAERQVRAAAPSE